MSQERLCADCGKPLLPFAHKLQIYCEECGSNAGKQRRYYARHFGPNASQDREKMEKYRSERNGRVRKWKESHPQEYKTAWEATPSRRRKTSRRWGQAQVFSAEEIEQRKEQNRQYQREWRKRRSYKI